MESKIREYILLIILNYSLSSGSHSKIGSLYIFSWSIQQLIFGNALNNFFC